MTGGDQARAGNTVYRLKFTVRHWRTKTCLLVRQPYLCPHWLAPCLPPANKTWRPCSVSFTHCLGRDELKPPVPVPEFGEVFLTGATGFIGRFLLRDLLVQDETPAWCTAWCAPGTSSMVSRGCGPPCSRHASGTRASRPAYGWWRGTLRWTDLAFPRLISPTSVQRVDAVYHVAADVALPLRMPKCARPPSGGLRQVLDLCLSHRFKHLFFTSSLGVFPQYFCDFRNEFEHSRITAQMQPDLNSMKQLYPLGLSGYPWSKLVAEQIMQYAQRAGLPLAIFRLPLSASSTTGFPNAAGFKSHLLGAIAAVGAKGRGMHFSWDTEPADVHSRLITEIS